jgi:hypothetical protein
MNPLKIAVQAKIGSMKDSNVVDARTLLFWNIREKRALGTPVSVASNESAEVLRIIRRPEMNVHCLPASVDSGCQFAIFGRRALDACIVCMGVCHAQVRLT